jgi:hypothetical protein
MNALDSSHSTIAEGSAKPLRIESESSISTIHLTTIVAQARAELPSNTMSVEPIYAKSIEEFKARTLPVTSAR